VKGDLERRIDALFDRELDSAARREVIGEVRHDAGACEEVARTQRIVSMLREPVESPDVTDDVLARVDRRRGFLTPRLRRMVTVGRLAAALGLVAIVGVTALARRWWPEATTLTPQPAPITAVVESGRADAADGLRTLMDSVDVAITPVLDRPASLAALLESPRMSDLPAFESATRVRFVGTPMLVQADLVEPGSVHTAGFDLAPPTTRRVVFIGIDPSRPLVAEMRPVIRVDGLRETSRERRVADDAR